MAGEAQPIVDDSPSSDSSVEVIAGADATVMCAEAEAPADAGESLVAGASLVKGDAVRHRVECQEAMARLLHGDVGAMYAFVATLCAYLHTDLPSPSEHTAFVAHIGERATHVLGDLFALGTRMDAAEPSVARLADEDDPDPDRPMDARAPNDADDRAPRSRTAIDRLAAGHRPQQVAYVVAGVALAYDGLHRAVLVGVAVRNASARARDGELWFVVAVVLALALRTTTLCAMLAGFIGYSQERAQQLTGVALLAHVASIVASSASAHADSGSEVA